MPSPTILQLNEQDGHRVYAWARYVFWADVEYQQYVAHQADDDEPAIGITIALIAQWYSALWVVIEGWEKSQLFRDPVIDELLDEKIFGSNRTLLRRLRNGVYHYQKDVFAQRLSEFMSDSEATFPWAFLVHQEFKRVVWEMAHPPGIGLDLQTELADTIEGIVGWLPKDIVEARPHEAALKYREVAEMILKSGGRNTPHSRELLAAVDNFRDVAQQAATNWTNRKRAMIECLKEGRSVTTLMPPNAEQE